jgi:predicted Rossmann-fold nucleotide-binding protein
MPGDDGTGQVGGAAPGGAAASADPEWGKDPGPPSVIRFLEGPQPRSFELWHAVQVFAEFILGFRSLHFVGPCVTVFGSARFAETHRYYTMGREVGALLARAGFTVMTGGGPGIMEAANRGAREVGGRSIGCNIELPHETATLIQTGKIQQFPLVLMGREYWAPLLAFLRDRLATERTIDAADAERFIVTDSASEAVELITQTALSRFGLTYGTAPKRRWFLWE